MTEETAHDRCKQARGGWVGGKQIPEGSNALIKPPWYRGPSVHIQQCEHLGCAQDGDHSTVPSLSLCPSRE